MRKRMTIDRAIEILDPEHREHYESIDPVNAACRMGMEALEYRKQKKVTIDQYDDGTYSYICPCGAEVEENQAYCDICGQALSFEGMVLPPKRR